jgi:hypothetical protein
MQDRRKAIRTRTYFGGQIAFNQQASVMDCLIRNISAAGARLVFTETRSVPQEFDLSVHKHERSYRAKVIWRRADEAGVAFLEPRPQAAPIALDLMRRLRECEADKASLRRRIEQLSSPE